MNTFRKSIIIIPARLDSTRLPKKPLINIKGIPMIIRVYNKALEANIGKVVVAGCNDELGNLINSYNFNYISTDPMLPSGTDRVYAAYKNLNEEYDNIINLQGDMPHINSMTIKKVNDVLNDEQDIDIATAASKINDIEDDINNINAVKVIKSYQNYALYFTRYPVRLDENYKHIGIYGFKANSLEKFVCLPQSPLEKNEKLEQLRALENGMKVKIVITNDPNISIDTKRDLLKSKDYLKKYEK
ncbi:3-deoxy-manno-octulosonate cytidylyltransferase [Rickettsiales endosymbiont of Trichoplax sp. H2]|uniref:3-deoxy-manno-octulosonate cytidylyltransferase n=1 Tax=Rickettsiales endosymbiont of Trichoplax sp. H2 TaxID=2021221 RepID=UPI0012B42D9A|nr:3-deoxy-manno-octulosonate cytidylyltransferase [Rickettsiales endosymbiont of Trichoplax sp. H2]MSO13219.1 3-deoxy-manno-octulosonate cytidylyltransferase [Rickettsiales endosymbiont of Trichoplax sp. H2]